MILCIDSGNTRVKWGLTDGTAWAAQGAVAHAELPELAAELAGLSKPHLAVVANVAGSDAASRIAAMLQSLGIEARFVRAEAAAGGVRNGYRDPSQLGVDRWCALLGARQRGSGAVLVVGVGTATTIDTLDASGLFRGGLILPGFDLMRSALADRTAQLPFAAGDWQAWPQCTDDAIASGCLEAQLGAIERAWSRLPADGGARCLLFGGGALRLAPHLRCPFEIADRLVLEGLRFLAR